MTCLYCLEDLVTGRHDAWTSECVSCGLLYSDDLLADETFDTERIVSDERYEIKRIPPQYESGRPDVVVHDMSALPV